MASKYPVARVGEVCYVTDGAHAKVDRQPHGVPYLTSKNIGVGQLLLGQVDYISVNDYKRLFANSYKSQRRLSSGDVLVGIIGTFGNAYLYKKQDHFGVSSAVALLRPDQSRLDPRFLYYVVTSPIFRAAHGAHKAGSVQGYTNIPTIKELPVPLPPLPEQYAIAHILGTLDDKIELNRRMNETLEAIAQALFKSWFVDFDPVRAKAEGRDTGLPPHIADLFPDGFEDSELGEIPRWWTVGCLGDVTRLLGGFAFRSQDWMTEGIPVVKIGSVKPGLVDLDQVSYVSERVSQQAKRFQLNPGDLLIGMTGYVGEVGLVPPTQSLPLLNQRVGKFEPKQGGLDWGFIYCLTRRSEFKAAVETRAHGTAQANVSAEGILSVPTVLPPLQTRHAFGLICHPLLHRILASHGQSRTLVEVRDCLLPKLISGEIRLKDAKKITERAS